MKAQKHFHQLFEGFFYVFFLQDPDKKHSVLRATSSRRAATFEEKHRLEMSRAAATTRRRFKDAIQALHHQKSTAPRLR